MKHSNDLLLSIEFGRNFDEIYQALIASKTADEVGIATPADWRPGDDVIVSLAGSCGVITVWRRKRKIQ